MRPVNRSARWTVRLLLAGVPALLVAGVASAAIISDDAPSASDTVAAGAGGQSSAVRPLSEGPPVPFAIPSPTGAPMPPAPPGSVPALPVQLPPLPVAPPSVPQSPAVSPTTTVASPAGTPAPTTAAAPSSTATTATVTLVNKYPAAVRLLVNGTAYELAPGQEMRGVKVVPAPSGNDTISLSRVDVPTCGIGDAMGYFVAGRSYVLTVAAALGACMADGTKGPVFDVTPA